MIDIKVDISKLKNEINSLYTEAHAGLHAKNDLERRDILDRLVEKLRTLKTRLEQV